MKLIKRYQTGNFIVKQPTSSVTVNKVYPKIKKKDERPLNEQILDRAESLVNPYHNYTDAVDVDKYNPIFLARVAADKGVSNCTLTASQIVNPAIPIASARTIINNPEKYQYHQISENRATPGTLIIASEPNKSDQLGSDNKYHTMILTGYADKDYDFEFQGRIFHIKKGEPLVHYSNGKNTYRKNIPLSVYNEMSQGKSVNRYYKHMSQNNPEVILPTITISKNQGGLLPKNKIGGVLKYQNKREMITLNFQKWFKKGGKLIPRKFQFGGIQNYIESWYQPFDPAVYVGKKGSNNNREAFVKRIYNEHLSALRNNSNTKGWDNDRLSNMAKFMTAHKIAENGWGEGGPWAGFGNAKTAQQFVDGMFKNYSKSMNASDYTNYVKNLDNGRSGRYNSVNPNYIKRLLTDFGLNSRVWKYLNNIV